MCLISISFSAPLWKPEPMSRSRPILCIFYGQPRAAVLQFIYPVGWAPPTIMYSAGSARPTFNCLFFSNFEP
jgi:hypothetical protein